LLVWVADDADLGSTPTKLAKIVRLTAPLLRTADIPVEVEYENGIVSQYPVSVTEVTPSGILLHLGLKPTACLAQDRCGIMTTDSACCVTPGSC